MSRRATFRWAGFALTLTVIAGGVVGFVIGRSTAASAPRPSVASYLEAIAAQTPLRSPSACISNTNQSGTLNACPAAAGVGQTVTITGSGPCGGDLGTDGRGSTESVAIIDFYGPGGGHASLGWLKTDPGGFKITYRIPKTYQGPYADSADIVVKPGLGYRFVANSPHSLPCEVPFVVSLPDGRS